MVFNKKDLAKAFSPNKVKKFAKKRMSGNGLAASSQNDNASQNIRVIVRLRPHNELELQDNHRTVIKVIDDKMLIFDPKEEENPFFYQGVAQKTRDLLKKQNKEMQFIFDKVFDSSASNIDVFEGTTKNLISNLLDGYNCSVFAYGATGAGKTHTMLGNAYDPGITYRTVAELYSQIEKQSSERYFNLGVTYLEIYNENVYDLLQKSAPLHLREDGKSGVVVAGLKVIAIQNAEELLTLLAKGNKNRTQHPTDANQESSRSHAVFQVYVKINNKLDGQVKQVKLSMIDLAGSERASATGCKGARFKEGANINKSLLALGNCINKLADGIKHIPYRDSKLTRLLKDSLGGNCQTIMIANVAPTNFSYEDTYNTLKYADRAKKIKTHIKKNIVSCEMHVSGYIKMVEDQKKEINMLKQKLLALENNNTVPEIKDKPNEETHKRIQEFGDKLTELFDKKRMLNEKMLSLESSDKILCCRMQYKKFADDRLHNLTSVDGLNSEDQHSSGRSRLNKSLHYFKRQRDSLRMQMEAIWDELCQVERDIRKLNVEMKTENLIQKLSDKTSLYNCEIEKCRMQQQFEHAKKISSLQQCEMKSLNAMIKMITSTLQKYHNLVRGYGTMTDSMKQEYKSLIKSLEGVRNIKWSDAEVDDHEEDFYSLTCLSIAEISDPLNNKIPINSLLYITDKENKQKTEVILNSTFDAENEEVENNEVQNTTATFEEDSISKSPDNKELVLTNDMSDVHNDTFSLKEKSRKRVLIDKNHVSGRSPSKMARKGPIKLKSNTTPSDLAGKENKDALKNVPMMSAKSIAILKKLKSDAYKSTLKDSKDVHGRTQTESPLKVVRGKERRGLMTTHPYTKPLAKAKPNAALPSTRIPW